MSFIIKNAELVIHGGFMDRVLGHRLDKRIPHKDLPALKCTIVDTTTIDDAHDDEMFNIIRELVEKPFEIDFDRLVRELCSLGAKIIQGGRA